MLNRFSRELSAWHVNSSRDCWQLNRRDGNCSKPSFAVSAWLLYFVSSCFNSLFLSLSLCCSFWTHLRLFWPLLLCLLILAIGGVTISLEKEFKPWLWRPSNSSLRLGPVALYFYQFAMLADKNITMCVSNSRCKITKKKFNSY